MTKRFEENIFNRRVMMMYISSVSGHRQATIAIEEELRRMDSTIEAPMINGFGYTYPNLEKIVNQAYMSVIKASPGIWEYIYDNPTIVKNSRAIKKFLNKNSQDKIHELFKQHRPDTVVCTQAFPCCMVADYKQKHHLETKLVAVLTDFAPHSFWINEGVDYYIVPSLDTKERFIEKGLPADMIKTYGIPIRSKFALQLNKRPIAANIGFDPDKPTVLIMGGGQGLGPIKAIVESLIMLKRDIQIIVLAGTNKRVVDLLKKETQRTSKKVLVLEFANNVDEFMDLATLIVTKPGGITTSECLAKGLPMVLVNSLPGQERRNADFLIENGIGIEVDNVYDIAREVEGLIDAPKKLSLMSKNAYTHAKPHATLDIAQLILGDNESPGIDLSDELELDRYV